MIATAQSDGSPTVAVPAMKGMKVLLKDAVSAVNWKGEIVLKMDPFSSLVADDDGGVESSELILIFRPNTTSAVPSSTPTKRVEIEATGKPWSRKGMMVMDHTGALQVEGWADDWNHQYSMLEVGDVVVLANLGPDAWATEVQGDYEVRGCKLLSGWTVQPP